MIKLLANSEDPEHIAPKEQCDLVLHCVLKHFGIKLAGVDVIFTSFLTVFQSYQDDGRLE